MKKRWLALLWLSMQMGGMNAASAWEMVPFAPFFEGYQGCFVLYDVSGDTIVRYNEKQCAKRLSPCSTFKIPNSLIGLESGVIRDASHVYPWDGVQRRRESWNHDHTLRSAIAESVVWYYQRLATEVGEKRMQDAIHKLHYGNEDISGGITQFWLGSSLLISADEQINFLYRLYKNDLPFSPRSIDIVKDILILSQDQYSVLRGKTGSGVIEGPWSWGWFVGYLSRGENVYIFACNIEGPKDAIGTKAKEITLAILERIGLREP